MSSTQSHDHPASEQRNQRSLLLKVTELVGEEERPHNGASALSYANWDFPLERQITSS